MVMTAASKYICVASVVMGTRFLVNFTPHDDLVSFMVFNANLNIQFIVRGRLDRMVVGFKNYL